jgi:hypothetical protein
MKKRRLIPVTVMLSVAPGMTKAQALRELRSRINDGCCYALEEREVRVRRAG